MEKKLLLLLNEQLLKESHSSKNSRVLIARDARVFSAVLRLESEAARYCTVATTLATPSLQ